MNEISNEKTNPIQNHWRLFSALILALGFIWIILTTLLVPLKAAGASSAPRRGFSAPEIELSTLSGELIRLEALKGKAVIINFWATWCAPCQAEMPALQAIHQNVPPDKLVILAINSTFQDDPTQIAAFASSKGLTFPILIDNSGMASNRYQVRALPTTFFVDQNGTIQEIAVGGPLNESYLAAQVDALLAGGR